MIRASAMLLTVSGFSATLVGIKLGGGLGLLTTLVGLCTLWFVVFDCMGWLK